MNPQKMSYLEPYPKENNLLQLSLYCFRKPCPKTTVTEWSDTEGNYRLECNSKYPVPGGFEQDVYTATMRLWIKQGMPNGVITLNYSNIARELGLIPKYWTEKIKNSLKRLTQARYELTRCFIKADKDGNRKITTGFSLYDSTSLFEHEKGKSKRHSKTELVFPGVIRENIEAKYYQLLDMAWYRSLPEGLPRRLYEYLDKRRYQNINGIFIISEEAICRWLPITTKHTTHRRKTLEKIAEDLIKAGYLKKFSFDRKRKLCHFTYAKSGPPKDSTTPKAITAKAKNEQPPPQVNSARQSINEQVKFAEALEWLCSIRYYHKKKRLAVATLPLSKVAEAYPRIKEEYEKQTDKGKPPRPNWVHQKFMNLAVTSPAIVTAKPEDNQGDQLELFTPETDSPEDLPELIAMMKPKNQGVKLPKKPGVQLSQALKKYLAEKGFDYVRWNILYANDNAKKRYTTYLKKALAENWGEDWAQEQQEETNRPPQPQAWENVQVGDTYDGLKITRKSADSGLILKDDRPVPWGLFKPELWEARG